MTQAGPIDPTPVHAAIACIALAVLLIASLRDLAVRTIPNALPVLLATAGVLQQGLAGHLPAATAVAGAVFVGTTLCWRFGLLGGGDVKLLSAASLFVAPAMVPDLLVATALAGALLAVAYLSLRPLLRDAPALAQVPRALPLPARIFATERRRIRRRGPLPYACAIAAGMGVTLLGG